MPPKLSLHSFPAKKSLGQHFLTSPKIAERIALSGSLQPGDVVLEIGPGTGMLTKELLKTGATVIAIEKDDRAIPYLFETFKSDISAKRLTIFHGDALKLSLRDLGIHGEYSVIANIPYYISGALIRHYLETEKQPKTIVFLVQKEVAKRIIEKKKQSLLSIAVQVYGNPSYIATVPARFFKPAPKVDSAILRIDAITKNFFARLDERTFFELVRLGFSSKRKKLLGNLAQKFSRVDLEHIFTETNLSFNARAEDLSLVEWKQLSSKLFS